MIWANLVDHESPILYTKIQPKSFLGSGEDVLAFYHISAWRPSCSMVRNHSNKLSIPFRQKMLCEIWRKLLTRFQRRRHLKDTQFYTWIYPKGKGRSSPGDKILIVTETFNNFNHTLQISAISRSYILRKWIFNIYPIQIFEGANFTLP